MSDEHRREDHQQQSGLAEAGRDARQCLGGVQGDGLFPRQFLRPGRFSHRGAQRVAGHDLETFCKRLKALEAKTAHEHMVLSEDQLRALERAREEKEAHGEIETAHPGYLGTQDTYYVGTIKSVGRIYQQTFLDT